MMKKILLTLLFAISSLSADQGSEETKTADVQTSLLLIRHGETDWNARHLYLGRTNIPLNETGIQQAQHLAAHLMEKHPGIAVIYSSDLDRASQTAFYTAQKFHLPVSRTPQLREIDFGEVEGLPVKEVEAQYGRDYTSLLTVYREERWKLPLFPGGESHHDLLSRVQNELRGIAESHPGKTIAVFAHGRVIRTLIAGSQGFHDDVPFLPNCAIVHFQVPDDGKGTLTFLRTESP